MRAASGQCTKLSLVDARNGGRILWTTGFAGTKRDGSPYSGEETRLGVVGDAVAAMTPTSVVAFRAEV